MNLAQSRLAVIIYSRWALADLQAAGRVLPFIDDAVHLMADFHRARTHQDQDTHFLRLEAVYLELEKYKNESWAVSQLPPFNVIFESVKYVINTAKGNITPGKEAISHILDWSETPWRKNVQPNV